MHRALLVDDEPPARELMRRLLAAHAATLEIIGEARSVADAAEKCTRLRPTLLFLDVQMPREDGFALLPRLTPPLPAIIFVTAYDAFAVRAFDVNAADYLLKPVAPARLTRALARVTVPAADAPAPNAPFQIDDTILLRSDHGLCSVPVTALTHIEAEENYTRVHLADMAPMLIRRTISEWERLLPSDHFVRIERSLLVQLAAVRALTTVSRDVAHLALLGRREPLVLARRASLRLRQALDARSR